MARARGGYSRVLASAFPKEVALELSSRWTGRNADRQATGGGLGRVWGRGVGLGWIPTEGTDETA